MSGPPAGIKLSPEQVAVMKEQGVRGVIMEDIGGAFGPFIMGFVFNLIMLGILYGQVWHWFTWAQKNKERAFIKIIVYWVLAFSTASTVFVVCWFFRLFVTGYGLYAPFVDNKWFSWLPVLDQTIVAACQVFNLERAYRIHDRRRWVLISISPFILATTTLIIARRAVASANGNPEFDAALMLRPFTQAYLFTNVGTDLLLTVAITLGLWKSRTGWKHTDSVITKIITYTIKSQLLPTALAIAIAVQYAIDYKTFVAFLYMLCNSKVPAVMFMAVLNYRFELQAVKPTAHRLSSSARLVSGNGTEPMDNKDDQMYDVSNAIPLVERRV